jgi:predicted nucleic acid-binding protein
MKNGLVIADSGPIFSLAIIDKFELLDSLFDEVKISKAVWEEISVDETKPFYDRIWKYFKNKVEQVKGFNELTFIMDYRESESVILYRELQADFLLIDDKKARKIAENLNVKCIGTLGLLSVAKDKGLIDQLKPHFEVLLKNKRYYSIDLLNSILTMKNENIIILSDRSKIEPDT